MSTILGVTVEQERARYGAWYELFPRSCATDPGSHGTFKDCEKRLSYVAAMGFDVLYLPPIHPIGLSFRKGPNNTLKAGPERPRQSVGHRRRGGRPQGDPSKPGHIGRLRTPHRGGAQQAIDIAMDIAFQCSPDHPYVKEHPEWFRHRPDGTIKYAENPPKKYQDIYPLDFECADWESLWNELLERGAFLGGARRAHLPRGQSAHQTVPLLGMAHRAGPARAFPTPSFFPRRSRGRR